MGCAGSKNKAPAGKKTEPNVKRDDHKPQHDDAFWPEPT